MPPVRESRHLWVGNIPDSITEEKLVEYFQRYSTLQYFSAIFLYLAILNQLLYEEQ